MDWIIPAAMLAFLLSKKKAPVGAETNVAPITARVVPPSEIKAPQKYWSPQALAMGQAPWQKAGFSSAIQLPTSEPVYASATGPVDPYNW